MSIQIIPPTEKQLSYFNSLASKLGIEDPEVPKSKAAAKTKIGEYKFKLTTSELATLSTRLNIKPAEFDASAITEAIDRKILSRPAMESAGIQRIHEANVDGDDPEIVAQQEKLRERFEIPYRQKHIDFELARLGLIDQQKLTGATATLADSNADYETRYQTMISELQRIRNLPTRRQSSAIRRHAERTGVAISLPATRKEAGNMVKELKDAIESNKRAAASGNVPDYLESPLPEASAGMTLKQEAQAHGGASGTAYQRDEYNRPSEPYWANEQDATANMSAEERSAFQKAQTEKEMSDEKLDALKVQVIDDMDPSLVNSLGNTRNWAESAGLDTRDFKFNENGAIQLESVEEAVAFIDRLSNARAYSVVEGKAIAQQTGDTPVAQRGQWGDAQEVEGPTERQLNYLRDLCEESGVRIREAGEAKIPVEGTRIYQDSIELPASKQQAGAAIEAVKERIEASTQAVQTAREIETMTPETADEVARALRPDERQVFELRFRQDNSRQDVAEKLDMSPKTFAKVERSVLNKVSRLTRQITPPASSAKASQASSASLNAQASAALPAL